MTIMLEVQYIPASKPGTTSTSEARVFWDRGSSLSLITHAWAQKQGLHSCPIIVTIKVVGQDFQRVTTREYTLELVDRAGTRFTIKAVGLPSISTSVSSFSMCMALISTSISSSMPWRNSSCTAGGGLPLRFWACAAITWSTI